MAFMIKLLFAATGRRTYAKFLRQCRTPRETQERLLKRIVSDNKNTEYGRKHGFDKITDFDGFQQTCPLNSYKDLEPYIEASLEGKPNQLTSDAPVFYALTSGTTGKPKFIPVTQAYKSLKSKLLRTWISKLYLDHPGIFDGYALTVVSPEAETYSKTGVPCGAESGHGYRSMPSVTKAFYCAPYEVFAMEDYTAKYYTLLRISAGLPISVIYAVNPSTVLLLAQKLGAFGDEIIEDVRNGTLSDKYAVTEEVRSILEPQLKPDPKRAAFLEEARRKGGGVLLPKHIWPELAAVGCWQGGTVGAYVKQFPEYYREGLPVRDVGYFSSEFRGSVPVEDGTSEGVLAIATNVYEFSKIAHDEREPGPHKLLKAHEVEVGEYYFIYVTTLSGLYRYDMNDVIQVTGKFEDTPIIQFVQKGKGVVSFTGEKLYEAQVIEAVRLSLQSFPANCEFIAAVGSMTQGNPKYEFLMEFAEPPADDEAQKLLAQIETELTKMNVEYEGKRASGRIDPPILSVVKAGAFDLYRKRQTEGGKNDSQFKILKLTTDASFADEFEVVKKYAGSSSVAVEV